MPRVQHMVATVLLAEKEARTKRLMIQKAVSGHDVSKWLKTKAEIRNEGDKDGQYAKLKIARPVRGQHRFKYCDGLYLDIHKFMKEREWAAVDQEGDTSGTTWLEIFALFDTTGARTERGQHVKDEAAAKRAYEREKRKQASKKRGIKGSAIVKPTLDEEIKRFKSIIRHITKHEGGSEHAGWFEMEKRAHLRRLGTLGIVGNQPAINATIKMTEDEKKNVARCIFEQKLGTDGKSLKKSTT